MIPWTCVCDLHTHPTPDRQQHILILCYSGPWASWKHEEAHAVIWGRAWFLAVEKKIVKNQEWSFINVLQKRCWEGLFGNLGLTQVFVHFICYSLAVCIICYSLAWILKDFMDRTSITNLCNTHSVPLTVCMSANFCMGNTLFLVVSKESTETALPKTSEQTLDLPIGTLSWTDSGVVNLEFFYVISCNLCYKLADCGCFREKGCEAIYSQTYITIYIWLTIVIDKVQPSTLFESPHVGSQAKVCTQVDRWLHTEHPVKRSVVMVLAFITASFTSQLLCLSFSYASVFLRIACRHPDLLVAMISHCFSSMSHFWRDFFRVCL